MWSVMVNVLRELEKNVFAHCWMKCSVDFSYILVIGGGVEFSSVLIGFRCSVHF